MFPKRNLTVLALGVPERERRILKTACLISQGRARTYTLAADPPQGDPDLVIVDGESEAALASRAADWRAVPALFVGRGDAAAEQSVIVLRPLVPTRVLATLDNVARRFVAAAPELIPPAARRDLRRP